MEPLEYRSHLPKKEYERERRGGASFRPSMCIWHGDSSVPWFLVIFYGKIAKGKNSRKIRKKAISKKIEIRFLSVWIVNKSVKGGIRTPGSLRTID